MIIVTCTTQKWNPNGASWTFWNFASTVSMVSEYGEKRNEQTNPRAPSINNPHQFMNMDDRTLWLLLSPESQQHFFFQIHSLEWLGFFKMLGLCKSQKKRSERFISFQTTHFYNSYQTLNFSPISTMSEVKGLSL
jgi:hypothetical protein